MAGSFVGEAYEVQHAMDYDTVKLVGKGYLKLLRVVGDAVDAYEYVARESVGDTVVEGDDIGVGVVVEVLLVDREYVVVGAEEVGEGAEVFMMGGDDGIDPLAKSVLVVESEIRVLRVERDAHY